MKYTYKTKTRRVSTEWVNCKKKQLNSSVPIQPEHACTQRYKDTNLLLGIYNRSSVN